MKRLIAFLSVVAIVAIACHKKAAPVVADRTVQPPPPVVAPPPKQDSTAVIDAVADIAAGKTVYETKCTRCHGAKDPANYTAERWPGILRSMIPRSKLTEVEAKQVTAFVIANAKKS